jgi:2-methylisocitrate lyase-like PEP mutase family enzyme
MGKTQRDKALTFEALHKAPGLFIIPNPWDAGSAFLLQHLGFKALATTSAGLAFSLAKPDGANAVSRDETLANCRAIAEATELPVAADLENGFGDAPEDCAETIRQAASVGLVGGSIEDSTGRGDTPIFALAHAAERVRAAAEAAHGLTFPFMLTARAENYLHGRADLKDTIRRLQAFQEAGADVLFAPGLRTADDIRAVTSSVDRPVNVIMGLSGVVFWAEELRQMGVKRISVGSSLARAALGEFLRGAKELATHGTFTYAADAVPHGELNALFARRS